MAKFYGKVGYAENVEKLTDNGQPTGVWLDSIIERNYYGDVIKNVRRLNQGDSVNYDVAVSNTISIVADAYANQHFFAIRYVEWMGSLWEVISAEVERPRLILTLGGKYNGPTA